MTTPVTKDEFERLQKDVATIADTVSGILGVKVLPDQLKSIAVVPVKPKTYDGLTAEQWQRVIDENFFVVVSDSGIDHAKSKETNINHWLILSELRTKGVYIFIAGSTWAHCTVVRQPGHRQPNFGETPVLHNDMRLLVKHRSGDVFHLYASQIHHWDIRGESDDIMEFVYYELTTGAK
jgi:hypothetical protein